MLTSDLDGDDDKDRAALDSFLGHMLNELNMQDKVRQPNPLMGG